VEGLTLPEAMNDLALVSTGMYGKPLLKQHGAPIRLVVPWKYGFKSIKSIQRIEFVDFQPDTFWSTLNPEAYPFEANVEPDVPRPWLQHEERMLGTNEIYPTKIYNGYAEYVAHLYPI
jgi:sulfoxide reductase catalytic subunit YedY